MNQSPLSQASDDRLLEMLFAGEEIVEEIELDDARIAVTSHRVLAFTPNGGGRRFDHADRPNVVDASVHPVGEGDYLSWCARSGTYGAVMVVGGYVIKGSGILETLGGTGTPGSQVVGGVGELMNTMTGLFVVLADVLLLVGGVLLLTALLLGGLYLSSRSEELVIERAGREPIRVPVSGKPAEDAARRIRAAVGIGSNARAD